MMINPDLIAPCGLYCGVCAIYIAHRDNNEKFKARLLNLYQGEVPGKGTLPNSEKKVAGGCHLDRNVPALLTEAGFCPRDLQAMYLPGPRVLTYNYWGTAEAA